MITKMDMATTDTMAVLHKAMASNIRTRATDANHRLVKPSVRARAEEGLDLDPDLGRPEMVPVQAPMRLTLIPMVCLRSAAPSLASTNRTRSSI
jgi:hypothetical protein